MGSTLPSSSIFCGVRMAGDHVLTLRVDEELLVEHVLAAGGSALSRRRFAESAPLLRTTWRRTLTADAPLRRDGCSAAYRLAGRSATELEDALMAPVSCT